MFKQTQNPLIFFAPFERFTQVRLAKTLDPGPRAKTNRYQPLAVKEIPRRNLTKKINIARKTPKIPHDIKGHMAKVESAMSAKRKIREP